MSLLPLAAVFQLAGLAASAAAEHFPADVHTQLIRRYLDAMELQNVAGGCVEVEVTIQAKLSKLNLQAGLRAWRSACPTGTVTYRALNSWGDGVVRREVIDRYLAAEGQAQEIGKIGITTSNYRFRFVRMFERASRRIHVFQLTPKRRRVGLFKGELWLDGQTGLPIHESGRFVKSPSVFVKHIEFARDYQIRDCAAVPSRMASTVETRLAGPAELSVQYGNRGEVD